MIPAGEQEAGEFAEFDTPAEELLRKLDEGDPVKFVTPAERLRTAARLAREVAERATPGPWGVGDRQFIADVMPEKFGEGKCVYCKGCGEPTWAGPGQRDGKRTVRHVHEKGEHWWPHGIYSRREDGDYLVVNDSDEYGYMRDEDAAQIALTDPVFLGLVADWLEVKAGHVEAVEPYQAPRLDFGMDPALALADLIIERVGGAS